MSIVQEYLKSKKKLELTKLYIVKSSPEGVKKPVETHAVEITQSSMLRGRDNEEFKINRYKLEDAPYTVDILAGRTSGTNDGYGTGVGDMWAWSYFCSLSKDEADRYYNEEVLRVQTKYGQNGK